MTSESDVDNWQLDRENHIETDKYKSVYVRGSVYSPTQTFLMLSDDNEVGSVLVRLTVEELDALIVLLRYRRSLIGDIFETKEAT